MTGTHIGAAAGLLSAALETPIGPLLVVAGNAGVRAVLWPDEDGSRIRRALAAAQTPAGSYRPGEVLAAASQQLQEYFRGERRTFEVPLDPHGTPFQLLAWRALGEIAFGVTSTYGRQARALGKPSAARAVGAANRANPLAVLVPCHRVIAGDGQLTGFAGGISAKSWLIAHEKCALGSIASLH